MRDVTLVLIPPPATNCHTFLVPHPIECDVLYGRPPVFDLAELVGPFSCLLDGIYLYLLVVKLLFVSHLECHLWSKALFWDLTPQCYLENVNTRVIYLLCDVIHMSGYVLKLTYEAIISLEFAVYIGSNACF